MNYKKILIVVLVSILGCSKCAFVDTLNKCSVHDQECQKNVIKKIIHESHKGVPELGMPSIDPVQIKNLNVSIPNVVDMTLVDGTVKGVKNCVIDKFETNLETLHAYLEVTCDILIKSKYKMHSDSPLLKNLLGGTLHGEGDGKVKLEKVKIKIDFPYRVEKRGDDTFLIGELKDFKFSFDVLGKIIFAADQLYLGDKESSKEIVKLLNENWKVLISSFGNHFFGKAMNIFHDYLQKFFNNVPTKYYILEDLTPYVK